MRLALAVRYGAREVRGLGMRLVFFVASLAVGVAAVVAVAGLGDATRNAVRAQARELLAADLAVSARRPLPDGLAQVVASAGGEMAEVRELATVAVAQASGRSRLVELKAVGPGYPFYGVLRTEPARPLSELLGVDGAVAAPETLAQLGVKVGDRVLVGGRPFTITAALIDEPDRSLGPFTFGPRLLIGLDGLAQTDLVALGSRVAFRALVRVPQGTDLVRLAERIRALPDGAWLRVRTASDAQPAVSRGISRVERYLGLVALLSLLIGGVGVAQTVRSWLATRLDAIAVLRCLGVTTGEVTALYLGQTVVLGFAASVLGGLVGVAVQIAAPSLVGSALPLLAVDPWLPGPWLRGLAVGVGVAILFGAPPLLAARRVPPVRVLRRSVDPIPLGWMTRAVIALGLVLGVTGLAYAQTGSPVLSATFTGALLVTVVVLAAAARAVIAALNRLPLDRLPWFLRHGLAGLARPGADTVASVVALGLGVLVVLTMSLVERRLTAQLDAELPRNAPSLFFVDVQPDQWPGLERILAGEGAVGVDSAPVVMARLRSVDGRSVETESLREDRGRQDGGEGRGDGDNRWALTREQRLTYGAELPPDNTLVAGHWWDDAAPNEVSIEEDYAQSIGAGLGSVLRFDVQGVPVELVVTSLRRVEWRTFRINFFLIVKPGMLDGAPQWRLVAATVPPAAEQPLQDRVAARFPNITVIPVRAVLEKVTAVLDRLGLGVRLLGGFTVLAGIAILGGAASAAAARRGREVALLKAVGCTRLQVATAFAVEYAVTGVVAGLIGAAGGSLAAWAVVTRGLDLGWRLDAGALAIAVVLSVVLATVAGLAVSVRALTRRPIEVLREL